MMDSDRGFLLVFTGWGVAASKRVRDDELVDVTERLPIGHCEPQGRSDDLHTGALPPHIRQCHTYFQVGYTNTEKHTQMHTEKTETHSNHTVTALCPLFSLWNIPVTFVNDSCSLAPECRQLYTLKTKTGKTQRFNPLSKK